MNWERVADAPVVEQTDFLAVEEGTGRLKHFLACEELVFNLWEPVVADLGYVSTKGVKV